MRGISTCLSGLVWLACVAAAVALGVVVPPDSGGPPSDDRGAALVPTGQVTVAERGRDSAADAATALARPLFAPGRRPATEAGSAAGPAVDPALPRLTGIIVDAGAGRAIFARPEDARPLAVGVHGRIGAYTVESINPGGVMLSGPGGPYRLQPRVSTGAAAPALPSIGMQALPLRQDPGRFAAPVGPLGMAIYSFSPAAPAAAPPPVLGFEAKP